MQFITNAKIFFFFALINIWFNVCYVNSMFYFIFYRKSDLLLKGMRYSRSYMSSFPMRIRETYLHKFTNCEQKKSCILFITIIRKGIIQCMSMGDMQNKDCRTLCKAERRLLLYSSINCYFCSHIILTSPPAEVNTNSPGRLLVSPVTLYESTRNKAGSCCRPFGCSPVFLCLFISPFVLTSGFPTIVQRQEAQPVWEWRVNLTICRWIHTLAHTLTHTCATRASV